MLITSAEKADCAEVVRYFKEKGMSELWVPKEIVYTKNPPVLGSGKFDYLTAQKQYLESISS